MTHSHDTHPARARRNAPMRVALGLLGLMAVAASAPPALAGDGPQTEGFRHGTAGSYAGYAQRPYTPAAQAPQLGDANFKFYCTDPAGYYPKVPVCARNWRVSPAQ